MLQRYLLMIMHANETPIVGVSVRHLLLSPQYAQVMCGVAGQVNPRTVRGGAHQRIDMTGEMACCIDDIQTAIVEEVVSLWKGADGCVVIF